MRFHTSSVLVFFALVAGGEVADEELAKAEVLLPKAVLLELNATRLAFLAWSAPPELLLLLAALPEAKPKSNKLRFMVGWWDKVSDGWWCQYSKSARNNLLFFLPWMLLRARPGHVNHSSTLLPYQI
jgi:hypothetical protein